MSDRRTRAFSLFVCQHGINWGTDGVARGTVGSLLNLNGIMCNFSMIQAVANYPTPTEKLQARESLPQFFKVGLNITRTTKIQFGPWPAHALKDRTPVIYRYTGYKDRPFSA